VKTLTEAQLKKTLESHRKWLIGEKGGEKADFASVDLRSANLYGANLRSANLRSANLRSADLYGANLCSANLCSADLYGANLCSANLCSANLCSADLRSANLRSANLRSANLGSKTFLGCALRLIGACNEAVDWVDEQDHSDFDALFGSARGEWRHWLISALGGAPSLQRLEIVFDFVAKGA
jgi:uncharacterized protein YjbI with pentapeptide repeats